MAPAASAEDDKTLYSIDLFGGYYEASPAVSVQTPEFFAVKSLENVSLRPKHPVAYMGLGGDIRYYPDGSPAYVPALGLRIAWPFNWGVETAVGPNGEGQLNLRSNFNYLATYLQLVGPGLGLEQGMRDVQFGGELRPALTYVSAAGTLSQGQLTTDVRGRGVSLSLLGEVHGCVRFDRKNRGCLFVAPTLFEGSGGRWLNGLQAGLRLEVGKRKRLRS